MCHRCMCFLDYFHSYQTESFKGVPLPQDEDSVWQELCDAGPNVRPAFPLELNIINLTFVFIAIGVITGCY